MRAPGEKWSIRDVLEWVFIGANTLKDAIEFLSNMHSKIPPEYQQELKKRIEKVLGFNLEDAKRDVTDEITYGVAVAALKDPLKKKEIDDFEDRLRQEDREKAEAYVLYVAKIVMQFMQETTEKTVPKKGETGPTISKTIKDISEGLKHAVDFLESLLARVGADADATFNARVEFLHGKNVFSLIKPKKEPSVLEKKATELAAKAGQKIKDAAARVKAEGASVTADAKLFREGARVFRENAQRRRS